MDGEVATTMLKDIVTEASLTGVLDEIVAILPVVIPVSITFIALRKGIAFLFDMLRSA